MITGPFDTPYEGGFFYFVIRCPPDYPIRPPRVKLMTTGQGQVRFNPNLYKNGKVCLSILGYVFFKFIIMICLVLIVFQKCLSYCVGFLYILNTCIVNKNLSLMEAIPIFLPLA
jgi:ubiquitin-protein ligase